MLPVFRDMSQSLFHMQVFFAYQSMFQSAECHSYSTFLTPHTSLNWWTSMRLAGCQFSAWVTLWKTNTQWRWLLWGHQTVSNIKPMLTSWYTWLILTWAMVLNPNLKCPQRLLLLTGTMDRYSLWGVDVELTDPFSADTWCYCHVILLVSVMLGCRQKWGQITKGSLPSES